MKKDLVMKIGTISINTNTLNHNYGAILHSWAFQQLLLKKVPLNVETEVIDYLPNYIKGMNLKYPFIYYLKKGKLRDSLLWFVYSISNARKYNKMEKFISENFKLTSKKYDEEKLNDATLPYDTIICESDVIWDPNHYKGGFENAFFMNLDSMKGMKKISYAASLGNARFTSSEEEEFSNLLKGVDHISVREEYARAYAQKFTEKSVTYVLDPTLLLDETDYSEITAERIIEEKYLLIYFPLEYNSKLIKQAQEYARLKGLKVVEISRYIWNKTRYKVFDNASMQEFLSLIKHAEVVFTNSFHGVCFSIIFKTEFYSFSRKTGLKIKNICDTLNLESRYLTDSFVEDKKLDYDQIYELLSKSREASYEYLIQSLKSSPKSNAY